MSAKVLDTKGRFRGKIVSFRCSEEENAALDVAVQLSGLTKQDYIISRVLQRDIVVQPNPRVYKALKDRLELVFTELKKNEEVATNSDLLETINLIAVTLNGIKGGEVECRKMKRPPLFHLLAQMRGSLSQATPIYHDQSPKSSGYQTK